MKNDAVIYLRVPPVLHYALKKRAKQEGITINDWATRCLAAHSSPLEAELQHVRRMLRMAIKEIGDA